MPVILLIVFTAEICQLTPSGIKPDLFLVAVISFTILSQKDVLYLCAIAGLGKDITCSTPIGLYVLLYVLIWLALTRIKQLVFLNNIFTFPAICFALGLVTSAIIGLITYSGAEKIIQVSMINAIYTTWISAVVIFVVKICKIAGLPSLS